VAAITFRWDEPKASLNLAKHGVSFDEATTVFSDEFAIIISDPDHSSLDEDRFLLLGMSSSSRALTVCHCIRHEQEKLDESESESTDKQDEQADLPGTIRIISARKATKTEIRTYEGKRNAR